MLRRRLAGVTGALLLVGVISACTYDSASDGSSEPTVTTTSTVAADPTLVACAQFATLWVEFAQIDIGAHGMGDTTPDPHGVRAREAADAAFKAAGQGSREAQRLGASAKGQWEGTVPGDVWATVTEFFALCGQSHPVVECEDEFSACRLNNMDRA